MAELEETIMRRAERHRHDCRELDVAAFGNLPRRARRNRAQFGVRAVEAGRHRLVAGSEVLDLGTDLDDLARRLIADDMRLGHERAALTVERVAAFDADGFDANDDAVGSTFGV